MAGIARRKTRVNAPAPVFVACEEQAVNARHKVYMGRPMPDPGAGHDEEFSGEGLFRRRPVGSQFLDRDRGERL
jgi:hypothetical protein